MKISLIMATKNAANVRPYIGQALSIAPIFDEVIVHCNNYASTKYVPQYRNSLILFQDDPISAPDALNKCVAQAKGDWIIPICDDDFCDINLLEQVVIQLREGLYQHKDIVYSAFTVGNEKDGWTKTDRHPIVNYDLLKEKNLLPFTSFYKKNIWELVGGYKNMVYNDWLFWMEAAKVGAQFIEWETPFFYFRQHHVQVPSLSDSEAIRQPFKVSRQQLIDYVEKPKC
jgi:glycosyltransferase involved in cell wall biosynthesis